MSNFLWDGFLMAVPLTLAVLGFNRGLQREAMTLIGILLGALLAEMLGSRWSVGAALRFNQNAPLMQALISDGLLLFGTVFIGYGGALLLPPRRHLAKGKVRLYGAVLGGFNGLLIIGMLLKYAALRGPQGSVPARVAATRVGPFLTQRIPDILLMGSGALALIVLVRLLQLLLRKLHGKPAATPTPQPNARPAAARNAPAAAARPASQPAGEKKPGAPAPTPTPAVPIATKVAPATPTDHAILQDLLRKDNKTGK